MKHAPSAGFTLTEMLVALFITGLVSAAGATLLVSAAQSGKRLDEFGDRLQHLEVGQALVRNDMAAMVPMTYDPGGEFGTAGGLAWKPFQNDGAFLKFYRNGWLHSQKVPLQSDLQAVEYAVENEALVRITHLPSVKKEDHPRRAIFEGVDRVQIRTRKDGSWLNEPDFNPFDEAQWPKLIEMTIYFVDDRTYKIVALSGARQ